MISYGQMDKKKELASVIAALKEIYQIAMQNNELNVALQTQKALASIISQAKDKEKSISLAKLTNEEIKELIQEGENEETTQEEEREENEQINKSHNTSQNHKKHIKKIKKKFEKQYGKTIHKTPEAIKAKGDPPKEKGVEFAKAIRIRLKKVKLNY